MYMLIKARILKKQGDLQEAINCLKTAMALPGVRAGGGKLADHCLPHRLACKMPNGTNRSDFVMHVRNLVL